MKIQHKIIAQPKNSLQDDWDQAVCYMTNPDLSLRGLAFRNFERLSRIPKYASYILTDRGIHRSIISSANNSELLEKIMANIFLNLTQHTNFSPVMINSHHISKAVFKLSQSNTPDIALPALQCIAKLLPHYKERPQLTFHSVSCALEKAAQSAHTRLAAVHCLRSLAQDRHYQPLIFNNQHLKVVLALGLNAENPAPLRSLAMDCLAHLATHPQNRAPILHSDEIMHPVKIAITMAVDGPDWTPTETAANAMKCLANMAWGRDTRHHIFENPGLFDSIVKALQHKKVIIQAQAMRCLSYLALRPENRSTLLSTPGLLDTIITAIDAEDPSVVTYALDSLANIALSPKPKDQGNILQHPRLTDSLLKAAQHGQSDIQARAMKCVAHIAYHRPSHRSLSPDSALRITVQQLSKAPHRNTCIQARSALDNLSGRRST